MFIAPGTGGEGLSTLGGYKLSTGSPAVNAGILMPWNTERDFFGNPVNDGAIDFGAYEQLGSGVFANMAVEQELNRVETAKRNLAWAKRMFPKTIQQPGDAVTISIALREPLDSGITATIALVNDQVKAKPLIIVADKKKGFCATGKKGFAIKCVDSCGIEEPAIH